ncbi:MAG TPA: CoA pyrophosphatase [Actinokineospora sp.]|nr:CoA pyrophosphatase [Actinokineospora sp.]
MTHGPLVDPVGLPSWLAPLVTATADLDPAMWRRFSEPDENARDAAVLILLGDGEGGPDVLLQLRADGNDKHSGQVAFPGGKSEPYDDGPVGTALREAIEETGVDPAGVRPVALLPPLHIPVSGFHVTPVIAHWVNPSPVWAVDAAETQAVARVSIAHLADPANRFMVRHPSGFTGPAFAAPDMLVWGFTAGLMTLLIAAGGWERPWDPTDVRDLDTAWRALSTRQA